MNIRTLERKRPEANPGAGESHLGGGNHGLNYTRSHRLLHLLACWYPWIMFADGIAVVALLAAWALAVTP